MKLVLEDRLHSVLILSRYQLASRGNWWGRVLIKLQLLLHSEAAKKAIFDFSMKHCSFQDDGLACAHTSMISVLGSLLRKLFFETIWKPGRDINSALGNELRISSAPWWLQLSSYPLEQIWWQH